MIRDRGVSRRYAAALFGAAVKLQREELILEDLRSLQQLWDRDRSFQEFLEAPDILTEQKVQLIRSILEGRTDALTVRFVLLMLQKKRVQHLPLVFDEYRSLVESHHNRSRARVVTAVPLSDDLTGHLQQRLEKLTGKTIRLERRVDPDIIGGVVVTIEGTIIDASLRHHLDEIRDRLLALRVHGTRA